MVVGGRQNTRTLRENLCENWRRNPCTNGLKIVRKSERQSVRILSAKYWKFTQRRHYKFTELNGDVF